MELKSAAAQVVQSNNLSKLIVPALAGAAFFISLSLVQASCNLAGRSYVNEILQATSNPFIALFIGLLSTALMQSSSTVTTVILVLVSSNILEIYSAVPMIMGANIGTTLTSTLVALGYMHNKRQYRKAISTATLHDFFNIFTALILFPLEYYFHFLSETAVFLSQLLPDSLPDTENNLSLGNGFGAQTIRYVMDLTGQNSMVLLLVSIAFLLLSLKVFSLTVKRSLSKVKLKSHLDFMFGSHLRALLTGIVTTAVVQSSSAVTTLVIPLSVNKQVKLKTVFHFIIGTNIGTTFTALIAAFGVSKLAVSLGLAHLLFNLIGLLIFYPESFMQNLILNTAKKIGRASWDNQLVGLLYIVLTFFLIPYLLIYLFSFFGE